MFTIYLMERSGSYTAQWICVRDKVHVSYLVYIVRRLGKKYLWPIFFFALFIFLSFSIVILFFFILTENREKHQIADTIQLQNFLLLIFSINNFFSRWNCFIYFQNIRLLRFSCFGSIFFFCFLVLYTLRLRRA